MRILVVGAMGRLGGRLVEVLKDHHTVLGADVIASADVVPLDITNFGATCALASDFKPDIVLHPAAWTDVDACVREPEKAIAINGYGAQNVAIAAKRVSAAMLYVSSNEVFNGKCCTPYREYDDTDPANAYGYSKLVGERAVVAVNPHHYIVRTAWLFAHGGKNFIQAILGAAKEGKQLRVVINEVANPTYNDDLAAAIAKLIKTGRYGTYHLTNEGSCSRYAFARYVLDNAGYNDIPIEPISSREWKRESIPPTYATLANTAGKLVDVALRPWQEAVNVFLDKEGLLK